MRYRESLEPDHDFDLIVVSVQHYSFPEAMSFLAPRAGRATVLVFNNLLVDPAAAVEALPADQVAWGFPAAGGGFGEDGVLRAALLPVVIFGTLGGPPSERAQAVRTVFREAGFRIRETTDFRGWLSIHFLQNAGLHTRACDWVRSANWPGTGTTCARRSWPPASSCPSPKPAASICGYIAATCCRSRRRSG